MGALVRQLKAMHLPGETGRGVQGFIGGSHLDLAVRQWHGFWASPDPLIRHATTQRYVSPLWLATLTMIIDSAMLVTGYVVTTLVVMARNAKKIGAVRPHLQPILPFCAVLILVVGGLDLVENILTIVLLPGYWHGTHTRNWIDGVVGVAASFKWGFGLIVIGAVLLLALVRCKDSSKETRTTVRLLRLQIAVLVAVLALFTLRIQLVDLMLRISLWEALLVVALAITLATTMWAMSRLIVTGHERRNPAQAHRRPPLWLGVAIVGPLVAVALWNVATGAQWVAPLIPLMIAVIVWAVGLGLRETPTKQERPLHRPLGAQGIFVPELLASTSIALGGLAAIQASVASYVQKGRIWVTVVLAAVLFTLALGALVATFEIEFRAVWTEKSPIDRTLAAVAGADPAGSKRSRRLYAGAAGASAVITAVLYALLVASPIEIAQAVGGVSIALVFLAALSLVLGGLILLTDWWVDRLRPPWALQAFDVRRIPVVTLLLIWAVAAAKLDDGSHWDIRTLAAGSATNTTESPKYAGVTIADAFDAWLGKATGRAGGTTHAGRTAIPLVIVATSGGGVRSAYWTALAMDCLFAGHKASTATTIKSDPCAPAGGRAVRPEDVFLATGISGGSVGLIEWDANGDVQPYRPSWVEERLRPDFVAPTLARGLLVEVPRSFLHFKAEGRDGVLERAWERAWGAPPNPLERGYLAAESDRLASGGPLLLLNGSSVFDGCSLNVSLLDAGSDVEQPEGRRPPGVGLGDCLSVTHYTKPRQYSEAAGPLPASTDLVDYLGCADSVDIRRSTAALLSARFPYVSGAGRLRACGAVSSTKYIVDGGYVDDSGAESAIGAWLGLQPLVERHNATSPTSCVIPYFVQLDNGYDPMTSPRDKTKPPNQLLAPLQALLKTTGTKSRQARARALAADLFSAAFSLTGPAGTGTGVGDRYAIIAPLGHPGLEAPLGWTLSEPSRRDLEDQLYGINAPAIRQVRGWLEHPPSCPS
jgi:hypothetical protein